MPYVDIIIVSPHFIYKNRNVFNLQMQGLGAEAQERWFDEEGCQAALQFLVWIQSTL